MESLKFEHKPTIYFHYFSLAILERIEAHEATPFRPFIGQRDCPPDVLDLMEKCWADNPEDRPAFVTIRSTMRGIMKYGSISISFCILLKLFPVAGVFVKI